MGSDLDVTRGLFGGGDEAVAQPAGAAVLDAEMSDGSRSEVIDGLLARRSVLETGPLSEVADAVLAANARAAEAELRAATLRSEAAARNWLPTLGPQVSLTSLGTVVTQMVVDQVLFDNGGKKAEREFARADVEVAAVALAIDTNDRVQTALELYLTAEAASARAGVTEAGIGRMEHFAYVMGERVRGGVSGRAELQIVQQKLNQMRADLATDREAAQTARAELAAMSARSLDGVRGLSAIGRTEGAAALDVMKARAESSRAVAEAKAARAGYLPGASANVTTGSGGTDGAITVGAPNGLSLNMGRELQAIEAQKEAAAARVGQAEEDARRSLAALEAELASLQRQVGQTRSLADQAAANYELYARQLEAGRRSVPDVVGLFETKIRTEREAVSLPYRVALQNVKISAHLGVLVDGEKI